MTKRQPKHVSYVNNEGEVFVRKRKKRKHKKEHKKRNILLIILAFIVVLVLLLFGAFCLAQEAGKNNLKTNFNEGKYIEYNGAKYEFNQNIVSTLIIGQDKDSEDQYDGFAGQADFILLMTLDTETGKMKGISIPRDTMVEIGEYFGGIAQMQGDNGFIQICLAYGYGDGKDKSCENTIKAVSRLLYNVPINQYLSLNLEGIVPLNDSIGGVTLVPIESIPNTPIKKDEKITLLGNNTRKYVQYRYKADPHSSEQRRARQVQYFQEFYKQAFSNKSDLGLAVKLFNIANNYSITNLGIPEFSYLASVVLENGLSDFSISAIEGTQTVGEKYVEIWPDQTKLYELVINTFYKKIDDVQQ